MWVPSQTRLCLELLRTSGFDQLRVCPVALMQIQNPEEQTRAFAQAVSQALHTRVTAAIDHSGRVQPLNFSLIKTCARQSQAAFCIGGPYDLLV